MLAQLYNDVVELCRQQSRLIGTQGHLHARKYLIQRFNQLGLQPYYRGQFELPYLVDGEEFFNLAGLWPGRDPSLPPILLVAHYDTCGDQPGADDNAAAISIWLDVVAEHFLSDQLTRDIILLFPDAEEPPHFLTQFMGSTNFYNRQRTGPIHCGLVLDLVGHDVPLAGLEDLIFIFGAESHAAWEHVLLGTNPPQGLRNIATLNRYVGDLSDHHILRENSEPYLFITCGRWEHYHQATDTPEKLNVDKMQKISHFLAQIIRKVDSLELQKQRTSHDPLAMEIALLHRAIGPYLEEQDISLADRNDVQRFVLNWVEEHHL